MSSQSQADINPFLSPPWSSRQGPRPTANIASPGLVDKHGVDEAAEDRRQADEEEQIR